MMFKRSKPRIINYDRPAGGWGSVHGLTDIVLREKLKPADIAVLRRQNKPDGFACVGCAWPKPEDPHIFEFCENGAKNTAWELTSLRCTPEFFAKHTCGELRQWSDHDLEQQGRLTHPMRWDAKSDRYLPISWESAFEEIGREMRAMQPDETVWYSSGRASLETSFMFQLAARLYGTNNLPDSSNMCHESTSVGLTESIGVGVGTTTLEDMDHADCLIYFGQNPGTNSPRALHPLQEAHRRGCAIITFNPIREPGLLKFTNPQSPTEMLVKKPTPLSSQYHQVKLGGDIAAIMGMAKTLLEADDAAKQAGRRPVLDHEFIAEHTEGFEAFAETVRNTPWQAIEYRSGLSRNAIEAAASVYAKSQRVMALYGMGITQHRAGVEAVRMVVNLLMMRGNIGKIGAGVCPVRGHSNVQGQRTMGISEKPELVPLDKMAERYKFEPPRNTGLNTVEACEAIIAGSIKAFVMLGGNFVRAVPEREAVEKAWSKIRLTVNVATKLNRSHLVHGEISFILPCIGRIEVDKNRPGNQALSIEDSTACVRGTLGVRPPASKHLLSEPKIVAALAKAVTDPNPAVDWDGWVDDYARVRTEIGEMFPEFKNMETRMWEPGGFYRDIPARKRIWKTDTGRAKFVNPESMAEDPDTREDDYDVLKMMTMRSNDQFNTTIFGYDDRFRGVKGTRMIVFMNSDDIARLGLHDGEIVGIATVFDDDVRREMTGFRVTTYDIPAGCIGAYYPEVNALAPLAHYAIGSKVPAVKSIPVRIFKLDGSERQMQAAE
jgi:molybdopterin-dependent oxidoreductase alpha subunit